MREVFADSDDDFDLPAPARRKRRAKDPVDGLRYLARVLHYAAAYPNRIASALLVGLVIAICVNALALQQSRHPAPLFHKSVPLPMPSPTPQRRVSQIQAMKPLRPLQDPIGQILQSPAQPISEPEISSRRTDEAAKSKPADAISRLLDSQATQSTPQPSKAVLAAQRALVKLGFVVKPDGIIGAATRQAIEQFEHDHGLPVRGELSPRILHELSAESGISRD